MRVEYVTKGKGGKGPGKAPGKAPGKGYGNPGARYGGRQAEEFLRAHRIEAHAADAFLGLPPDLQGLVMEAGSLSDARDPTAVLLSRIGKARQGTLKVAQMKPGDWKCHSCGDLNFARNESCRKCGAPKEDSFRHIDEYLEKFNIDEHAAQLFRELPPDLQGLVMEAGSLADARDPTAVLMSRMGKARQGTLQLPKMKPGDWKCPSCGELNFARNAECRACGAPKDEAGHTPVGANPEVDDYLEQNGIELHAAESFRSLPPDLQYLVMDSGSLADARDPTAVLISRINKARQGTLRAPEVRPGDWECEYCGEHNFSRNTECRSCGRPGPEGGGRGGKGGKSHGKARAPPQYSFESREDPHSRKRRMDPEPSYYGNKMPRTGGRAYNGYAEEFIRANRIEAHAADSFRALPPDLQGLVMDIGSLADARDPTAVLLSRMNKARQGTLRVAQMKPGDWKCTSCGDLNFARNESCRRCGAPKEDSFRHIEAYLSRHNVDEHAAQKFRDLPPDMQSLVMDAGGLADARDPTAVLMSRMKKAMQGTLQAAEIKPGDWKCQECGFMNFARNDSCKQCDAPKPLEEGRAPGETNPEVENYIDEFQIQEHAAESLRNLPPHQQALVMEAGSLSDARDPTAVLISRISKARQGTLKPARVMPGDWECPACGDHNFKRNTECRKCGAPAP